MAKNDITGDRLVSKANTRAFDENFDSIFGTKKPQPVKMGCTTCATHCDYNTLRNCGSTLLHWTPEVK